MRKVVPLLFLTLFSKFVVAQKPLPKPANEYAAIDKIALQLPLLQVKSTQDIADFVNAHFRNNADKARAIFIWTATNIAYDVDNMFAIDFYESKQHKIDKAIRSGKGICENYAAIFNDVAGKCGIESFVIEGYTRQNGVAAFVPHAWCAAQIDNAWYLFDPTWASGYVSNGKFTKKINNEYYKVAPAVSIKSHMPFDPMWEFLNYQVTNQEFYDEKTQVNKSKLYFSYTDSIVAYEKETDREQLVSSARRIEGNGVKNALVYDRLRHIKEELEVKNQHETVGEYNTAAADYNDAVNLFNVFINYYNNQFQPTKDDAGIKQMIDTAGEKLVSARKHLENIHNADAPTLALMSGLQNSIAQIQNHVDEQKEFIDKYMNKSKMGRKMMFHKYTWMGMPLN